MKGLDRIINNPYCILGLSCNASKIDIIKAQEKLNKLAKIGAENTYKTEFSNELLPEINRTTGIIQSSIVNIDNPINKLFWFVNSFYIINFDSIDVINEFMSTSNYEEIKYDSFLANYLRAIYNDPNFLIINDWIKIFSYLDYLLISADSHKKMILETRYKDLDDGSWDTIFEDLSKEILNPIEMLVENTNFETIISLQAILNKFEAKEFKQLTDNLIELLVVNLEKECVKIDDYFNSHEDFKYLSKNQEEQLVKFTNNLISTGKKIIDPLVITNKVTMDRLKDIIYVQFVRLGNVFTNTKSFKNAYSCIKKADNYAPSHKKLEAAETLQMYEYIKNTIDSIKAHGGTEFLRIETRRLLQSEDLDIVIMAYRAIGGDPLVQYILGNIYKTKIFDRKVPISINYNLDEAIYWLKKSADQCFPEGQLALGMCCLVGDGVYRDPDLADKLIRKAAAQGNQEAIDILNDYRYESVRGSSYNTNTYSSSSSNSNSSSYSWIWWLIGFIFIIILMAGGN